MNYPNRIIKKGELDKEIVKAIQNQLNLKSCGPVGVDGDFGDITVGAVKLFQSRHSDATGTPLKADGQIGQITWSVLFGIESIPSDNNAPSLLLSEALKVATSQIGVKETGRNEGPQVNIYLKSVGLDAVGNNYSWCAAFVYWCFKQASTQLNVTNPLYKTAGCLEHWNNAKCTKLSISQALKDPSKIKPGFIFIIDFGHGHGHTGIVESVNGGYLTTIEGNTNPELSSNGYGVFRLNRRKIKDITKGFLDYSKEGN
ncbi:CHAP domain-containing protein [Flavobacterium sp. SUN052]|uniref:CHAP domain-containing protein n=1 Tax=Flavobacterium sp. SUN052 TaxID=3002441 RepID=UPI00237DFB37|nr:CHAP domain-containing protein [Flavobacterium sp. SUN052]MEC4004901.1 CHAP domain-containing protein [Flavobacterium sp. SUN052]